MEMLLLHRLQVTSCQDIERIASMMCSNLCFEGDLDINPNNISDEKFVEQMKNRTKYCILVICFDDYNRGKERRIVAFGEERNVLKQFGIA